MKTLRHLTNTAFVVSLALLASCSSDNDIEVNNENNNNNANVPAEKLRFSATVEPNVVSRATLNQDDNTLHWDANDKIAVYSPKANKIEEFTVESQYAGQTVAYFSSDKPSTLTPPDNSGSFPYYYAFYPAEAVKGLATASSSSAYNRAQGYIPTEQKVTEGYTYDKSAILMMARATPAEKAFSFQNVNALVKVTITNNDNGKVKYIKLFANNEKLMTGTATFWITTSVGTSLTSGADTKNYVQLEIPASSGSVDYYLSVHQNTFDAGFTLLLESEFDETTHSQSIYQRVNKNSIQFAKSNIYNLGDYDVSRLKYLNNVVDLDLPSNTIWTTKNLEDGDNGKAKFVDDFYSYGGYYSWGETSTKATNAYNQNNYPLYNKKDAYNTSNVLKTDYDVAYQMNSVYRIPSYSQFTELLNAGFTQTNTLSGNGNRGIKFTNSKGRYIWFPAGGCNYANITGSSSVHDAGTMAQYWSRTVHHSNSEPNAETYAKCFDISSSGEYSHGILSGTGKGYDRRFAGKSIRPVLYK